jgi:hypothetical protein
MGRRAGAVLAVVTAPSHRGEGWGGVRKREGLPDLGFEGKIDCHFFEM